MTKLIFDWQRQQGQAAWSAAMPGEVTLYVAPEHTRGFSGDPRRGTAWTYGASHWNERTRTVSRFGRDVWSERAANRLAAMRAAEELYRATIGEKE